MTSLHIVALASLLVNILLIAVIRYLAVDSGFRIKTRQAGALSMFLAFGPRIWVYGDVDRLSLINDALTSATQSGHDRFNEIMRWTCAQTRRRADDALVYGGDELRWGVRPRLFGPDQGHAFCAHIQQVLAAAPMTDDERARLLAATDADHIRITLAYAHSSGLLTHRRALQAAKLAVQQAKPKDGVGQRGAILIAS